MGESCRKIRVNKIHFYVGDLRDTSISKFPRQGLREPLGHLRLSMRKHSPVDSCHPLMQGLPWFWVLTLLPENLLSLTSWQRSPRRWTGCFWGKLPQVHLGEVKPRFIWAYGSGWNSTDRTQKIRNVGMPEVSDAAAARSFFGSGSAPVTPHPFQVVLRIALSPPIQSPIRRVLKGRSKGKGISDELTLKALLDTLPPSETTNKHPKYAFPLLGG